MDIYILTYILLCLLAAIEIYSVSEKVTYVFYLVVYIILVLQVGLRWETGTDWGVYYEHFQGLSDFESASPLYTGMEYGYSLLCLASKFFSSSYTMLLIIHSILYYYFILKGLRRLSPYGLLAILLFYSFSMGVMGSHRQLIAVALILYSTRYILSKQVWIYLFFLVIASIFHTTAIICIFLYFLNRRVNMYLMLGLVIFSFLLGKTAIPASAFNILGGIGGISDKILFYLEGGKELAMEYGVSFAGLIKRLIYVGIFLFSRDRMEKKLPHYNLMLNSYMLGIFIYFLFSSSLTVLVSRGSLYFNMFEPILLSCQLLLFKTAKEKLILGMVLFVLAIFYFKQSIAQYTDLFVPYKGIFINKDYNRYY
ncbi:MAG: EpsG family protein [Pedobacter sp.]